MLLPNNGTGCQIDSSTKRLLDEDYEYPPHKNQYRHRAGIYARKYHQMQFLAVDNRLDDEDSSDAACDRHDRVLAVRAAIENFRKTFKDQPCKIQPKVVDRKPEKIGPVKWLELTDAELAARRKMLNPLVERDAKWLRILEKLYGPANQNSAH